MVWAYWIVVTFCVYTIAGYAGCLWLLGKFKKKARLQAEILPQVSVLIAIRGAEAVIEDKLRNCIASDYPKDHLEFVVICDGPSPVVETIVQRYGQQRVRLLSVERRGKSFALGKALEQTTAEIVVFTDVGVRLDPHGIRRIVSNFADPHVGCVSSEDATLDSDGNCESLYISFDSRLRRLESNVCSLINASGSFFAARREVCQKWNPVMSSDFFVPLRSIEAGYDVVVDPDAIGYVGSVRAEQEYQRKVRTIVHGLHVFFCHLRLLNPCKHGLVSWQLASHKLFRWMLPFALLALLICNAFLWKDSRFYEITLVGQVAFYLAGAVCWSVKSLRRISLFKIAWFFILGNAATLRAWFEFASGERYVSWQPSRR